MFNLRVGNIAGIPIRIHITWIVLALFGAGTIQPWFQNSARSFAIVTMLLILLSIILHEIAHALVARRRGLKVAHITLMLTGGVTTLEHDITTPGDEFTIGIAGPLISLGLAIGGGMLGWLSSGAWQTLWWIVAGFNTILVVINMIPCQPLDGGRIIRAIFWFLHNDMLQASIITSTISRWIGNAMMVFGVILLVSQQTWAGIVLLVGGWMTTRTTIIHYTQTLVNYALSKVTVRDLMQVHFRTVSPNITLDSFINQYILGQPDLGFLVVQAEQVVGLMLVKYVYRYAMSQRPQIMIGEAMTPYHDLPVITPDDNAQQAYHLLLHQRFEMLPVTENAKPLGLISQHDILEFIQRNLKEQLKK